MNGVFHFFVFQERVWYIRKFKIQQDDDNEKLAFKANLGPYYSYPLTLSNVSELSWSWIPYPSSGRQIKFRRGLFTFSTQREIRHFHVVVVQKRQRNVQKRWDARAELFAN